MVISFSGSTSSDPCELALFRRKMLLEDAEGRRCSLIKNWLTSLQILFYHHSSIKSFSSIRYIEIFLIWSISIRRRNFPPQKPGTRAISMLQLETFKIPPFSRQSTADCVFFSPCKNNVLLKAFPSNRRLSSKFEHQTSP